MKMYVCDSKRYVCHYLHEFLDVYVCKNVHGVCKRFFSFKNIRMRHICVLDLYINVSEFLNV